MRTWVALAVVLAALAAVLVFGLGLLGGDEKTDPAPPAENGKDASEEASKESPTLVPPGPAEEAPPEAQPKVEEFPISEELNVLLVTTFPQRFNVFLSRQWNAHPKVRVVSWVPPYPEGTDPDALPSPERLPNILSDAPRRTTLDDEDIHVVVVHDVDPAVLERDFWLEVSERVQKGQLGLLLVAGVLHGRAMLDHDVLATRIPVAKARAIQGQPVPGTFVGEVPYSVTEAGKRHPSTRLVSWPGWSGRIWISRGLLERPWGMKFCYPVEEAAPGAQVLLRAQPAQGDPWATMIVGDPKGGRVLWFGADNLGSRFAYGDPRVVEDWQKLVRNWITWLAGRVEE